MNIFFRLFCIPLILSPLLTKAQITINPDGSSPDNSAMLDVISAEKGFLPPRLTITQILAIPNPAMGLMVFCTTDNKYYIFNSTTNQWGEIMYNFSQTIPILYDVPYDTIYIGNGTDPTMYPYDTYWHDARTQMLYTADEISTAGGHSFVYIIRVGFDVSKISHAPMNGFHIKMKNTTTSTLLDWESDLTIVYSGTFTVTSLGWQEIVLQTPFYLTGDNLLIEICFDNDRYDSASYVRSTVNPISPFRSTIYYRMDGSHGCDLPHQYNGGYRPNLRYVDAISLPALIPEIPALIKQ